MIGHIQELIENALEHLIQRDEIHLETTPDIQVERARNPEHGDYASNVALVLQKQLKQAPLAIADIIVKAMNQSKHIKHVEAVKPGFINFTLTDNCRLQVIRKILERGKDFGSNDIGKDQHVTVEFVSANPTGPLHVGHGRGAAYGSSLVNVLKKSGFKVHAEYYVNDNGRQMDILATSVWLRYLELCGDQLRFPDNGYQGDYIVDIARQVRAKFGDDLRVDVNQLFDQVSKDESMGGDKEAHIDDVIQNTKNLLNDNYQKVFNMALKQILSGIKEDLEDFNVHYDEWFSEKKLHQSDWIERAMQRLKDGDHVFKKDGAWWFNASYFGDDKDRVLMRENGQKTYFASDVAYLMNKMERGFDRAIYIFGADHHGYISRLKAAAKALGYDADKVDIQLVQFANLFKGKEKLKMSTRSGSFITLKTLVDEVGTDAARYFYVMRSHDQHLDFDLELAKSQTKDNPVFYIQYAHARICSVFRQLDAQNMPYNEEIGNVNLKLLDSDYEKALIRQLSMYAETIAKAAASYQVNTIANYLKDLAQAFHQFYAHCKIQGNNEDLRNARLNLCSATRYILADGLALIGSSAPTEMYSEDFDHND